MAKLFDFFDNSREEQARTAAAGSRSNFGDLLNNLIKRGQGLVNQPALSAQDLFGDSLTRIFDATGQSANATKQALSRAILGRGGDVSGRSGAALLGVNQGTAEELGKTGLQFERLADQVNRSNTGRGENLLSQGLQGLQNLLSFDESRLQTILQREIQKDQAKRQRRSNLFGNILQGAATIGSAALLACWVAEELYGRDSHKVTAIRSMLFMNEGKPNMYGEFLEEYKENGRMWAKIVRDHKPTRIKAERLFNELYEVAKAA